MLKDINFLCVCAKFYKAQASTGNLILGRVDCMV